MGEMVLVTGAARSGKSRFAESLAGGAGKVVYIATAQVLDAEMKTRVHLHRERRPDAWITVEEPWQVARVIKDQGDPGSTVLVDCITLWLSNLLFRVTGADASPPGEETVPQAQEMALLAEVEAFSRAAREHPGRVILVSNEVGWGIVPASPLARFYRDLAGKANQILAAAADQVYLVVAGLELKLK